MWEHSIDLLWLIVLIEFQGGQECNPHAEAVRFLQSEGIKIPKIDTKNIKISNAVQVP